MTGRSASLRRAPCAFEAQPLVENSDSITSNEAAYRRATAGLEDPGAPLSMLCARRCLRTALRAAASLQRQQLEQQQTAARRALRLLRTSAAVRSDALVVPPLDGAPKRYSPKIQQLVSDIASLTLLEVSDLNELLKKTLNIKDAGTMPMGTMAASAAPGPQAAEEEAPVKKEKTHFTVKLTDVNAAEKVKLIKEVKNCIQGLNLVQAKKLVESLPQEIRANVSKDEAAKLKAALEAAGGTVVLE
ncbi:39S ribosomal protein L12, mitochondrial isoform X2 [Phycodurus eques]|uniref:39S ribosomal protein L12, mitochondrial isoform X2 n=1 Tax=Phycodurus eques TaxID=693459 RepID=UPI002ACD3851|nr:39S ribosomal protein L12, mitochondrial isoform X2 [Phycodurus eques]